MLKIENFEERSIRLASADVLVQDDLPAAARVLNAPRKPVISLKFSYITGTHYS